MPNFDSSLGSKQVTNRPLREYDIPDESEVSTSAPQIDMNAARQFQAKMNYEGRSTAELEQIEADFKRAREAKLSGKERLSEGARSRIDKLLGIVRGTHVVEIEEITYGLQTLKNKETRDAIREAAKFDSIQFPYEIRRQLLARSLTQIAGVDIDQFLSSNSIEIKLNFIDDLDAALTDRLYNEYLAMVKDADKRYAIKTEEEAAAIVEDLKK